MDFILGSLQITDSLVHCHILGARKQAKKTRAVPITIFRELIVHGHKIDHN